MSRLFRSWSVPANGSGYTGNGSDPQLYASVNSAANPAARGSVIVLYGTGEGQTNPAGVDGRIAASVYPKPVLPVKVTIGRVDATAGILYVGAAPDLVAGVFQLNVTVPTGVPAGSRSGGGHDRIGVQPVRPHGFT